MARSQICDGQEKEITVTKESMMEKLLVHQGNEIVAEIVTEMKDDVLHLHLQVIIIYFIDHVNQINQNSHLFVNSL